ncbi:helix-turn-helix domain-containing protein [Phycicoccus sp. MAQZ13P-2]|uniref:nSTAND1 domain-containing NTPase n=1 Tax=Phycicoccus mangrovi TaxID=2840470 RepID=UPI001C000A16|nr:helix-turn-helix domain-containing protein [Phycicoccus mangrovi]MBT9256793.1 helix-turn-helix domain-containing protein [Phycicoccus mangrovi]MBT9275058.1 helix-turn-helix domain-containing protein [Phycicoccus mangrovi]
MEGSGGKVDALVGPMVPDAIRSADELAAHLTEARRRVGLTVRQLARRSGLPHSTVGGYLTGRHLPPATRPEVLLALLAALEVPVPEPEAWHRVLWRLANTRRPRTDGAAEPFPGLMPFEADAAPFFFGREQEVTDLVARVDDAVRAGRTGFGVPLVLVVGSSGSGKSSLVRAGLLPRLDPGTLTAVVRPGTDPPRAFAEARERLSAAPAPAVVVVDQLEELWTLSDPHLGLASLRDLLAGCPDGTVVVAALRADFYGAATRHPVLAEALRTRQLVLEPLGEAALARTVTGPCDRAGIELAPGLVDRIVADARVTGGGGAVRSLPHVSHCLRQMWDRRERNILSHALYEEVGRIEGALSSTAEAFWSSLHESERPVARALLLRLVVVEDGVPPTAGEVPLEAVRHDPEQRIAHRLSVDRLVTLDGHSVRLCHEALTTAWPRMAEWIEEDRAVLKTMRLVEREAAEWSASGRDDDLLLRGARLEAAAALDADGTSRLSPLGAEFVRAGTAAATADRQRAQRQVRRRRRWLVVTSVVSLVAVVACLGLVLGAQRLRVARDDATSRQLAAQARDLADLDPAMSAQLALAAGTTADTLEGRSAVVDAAASPTTVNVNGPTGLRFVAASPSAGLLASAGESPDLLVYDVSGVLPRRVATLSSPVDGSPGGAVFALAVSDDGRWLGAGGTAGILRVWDLSDRTHPRVVLDVPDVGGTVNDLAFTADSTTLVVGAAAGVDDPVVPVRRWRLVDGPTELDPLPSRAQVSAVAVLAGGLVAVGDAEGHLVVRDPARPKTPVDDRRVTERQVTGIAQRGGILAVSTRAAAAFLVPWDRERRALGEPRAVGAFANWVNDAAASPGADLLAFASSDKTVTVVDDAGTVRETVDVADNVTAVTFVDDRRLAVAVVNGQVLLRDLPPYPGNGGIGTVYSTGWARDRPLAVVNTVGAGTDQDVSIWDVRDPSRPRETGRIRSGPAPGRSVGGGDISPDGRLLVYVTDAGYLVGVDVTDPAHPVDSFRRKITTSTVEQLSFVADDVVAAASDDQHVRLLRVARGERPVTVADLTGPMGSAELLFSVSAAADLSTVVSSSSTGAVYVWRPQEGTEPVAVLATPGYAYAAALSPDGRLLAVSGTDRSIRVWDLSTPARPRAVSTFGGATGTTFTLQFDAEGRRLLAAVNDGSLVLWRRDGTRFTRSLVLDRGTPLYFARFSPDGSHVLAGGLGGYTKLAPTSAALATTSLCRTVGDWIPATRWSASIAVPDLADPCVGSPDEPRATPQ